MSAQLTVLQRRVAVAQEQLPVLQAATEGAAEAYELAALDRDQAGTLAVQAGQALARARTATATARDSLALLVHDAYMTGGPLTGMGSRLSAGGPSAWMYRAQVLDRIVGIRQGALSDLADDQAARLDAQRDVVRSADHAQDAADLAAGRKLDAERADAAQRALVARLQADRTELDVRLRAAYGTVGALERERALAVLARAETSLRASAARVTALALPLWGPVDGPTATAAQGRRAVAWARTALGLPYSWGAGSPAGPTLGATGPAGDQGRVTSGFDCSGLTLYAWAHADRRLLHFTGYQWRSGVHVPLEQLRPGDLVFFALDVLDPATIHHVGLYAGSGLMIHAPHTGAVVRLDPVFRPGLIGVVRP